MLRAALFLLLLAPALLAQDAKASKKETDAKKPSEKPEAVEEQPPEPEHDELGFPIMFNGQTITRRDILREMGVTDESTIGRFRDSRDQVLRKMLEARVGEMLGLRVQDVQLRAFLERDIEKAGGEAAFAEKLDDEGETREGYMKRLRTHIVGWFIDQRLDPNVPSALQRPMPFDLDARPREVQIAYERDGHERFKDIARVRALTTIVNLDHKERLKIVAANGNDAAKGKAAIQAREKEILAEVLKELETKSFAEVAKSRGEDVDGQTEVWTALPEKAGGRKEFEFLLKAKSGETSPPIPRAGSGYLLIHVLEVDRRTNRGLRDPDVYEYYRGTIQNLRKRKAQSLLLLRALDDSTIRPVMVRDALRKTLVAGLGEAETSLRQLGLH